MQCKHYVNSCQCAANSRFPVFGTLCNLFSNIFDLQFTESWMQNHGYEGPTVYCNGSFHTTNILMDFYKFLSKL